MVAIKILTLNMAGLNNPIKQGRIERFIKAEKVDILCLQETHLHQKE